MKIFLNKEAAFTPDDTRLIAVQTNSLGNSLSSTGATLLSIE